MASPFFIKKLTLLKLADQPEVGSMELEALLDKKAHRVMGSMESEMCLWQPPAGLKSKTLLHESQGQRLMMVEKHKRKLSGALVKEALAKEVHRIEEESGQRLSKKAVKDIKDRIRDSLLPSAPVSVTRIYVWWDVDASLLALSTVSSNDIDMARKLLQETLPGGITTHPISTQEDPGHVMTQWLLDEEARPMWLSLGSSTVLVGADKARYAGNHVNLEGDEINVMLQQGYKVSELAVSMPSHADFTLNRHLQLKKIAFAPEVSEEVDSEAPDDPLAAFESSFFIMADSLRWIAAQVIEAHGGTASAE